MKVGFFVTSLLGSAAAELIELHDWVKNIAFVDHQGNEHIVHRLESGPITFDYSLVNQEHDLSTFVVEEGNYAKRDTYHPPPPCPRYFPGCYLEGEPKEVEKRDVKHGLPPCPGGGHYVGCWHDGTPKEVEKRGSTFGPCGDLDCLKDETPEAT